MVFNDGQQYGLLKFNNGKYFLADTKTDIAILKIQKGNRVLTPIKFDNSNNLRQGEWVLAIGNPFGLSQSITSGIVSSKGRQNIGFIDIEDFIQTDVAINPGNSGGPLINLYGRMVGLNTAIRTESGGYQGISFAIPSNIVKMVYYELRKYGKVRRGWIGFIAKEERNRVRVLTVLKGSPARRAGIKKGDIIFKINGKSIRTLGNMISIIGSKSVNSIIRILVKRHNRLKIFNIKLYEKQVYKHRRYIMQKLLKQYGIEVDENVSLKQVLVSYVSPRSFDIGLKYGDTVLRLNNKSVRNISQFIKEYSYRKKIFSIEVKRNNKIYYLRLSE